jgi:hypothetical protein
MRIRNTHLAYPRPAVEGISNCYRGHGYVQRGSASSYSTCVHVSVNWRCTCTNMRECRVLGSMSRCSFDLQWMNTVCMSCCRIQIDPKQFSQFCRKSITGRISMSLRSSSLGALRFSPTLTLDLNLHVASVNPPTLIIHHSTYFMCCWHWEQTLHRHIVRWRKKFHINPGISNISGHAWFIGRCDAPGWRFFVSVHLRRDE